MDEPAVELSIVICTRNRAANLQAMLEALGSIHSARRWDVLLVDNASTDGTSRILAAAAGRSRHLRTTAVNKIGLGNARDAAWRQTSGEVVAFTDDDCYLTPGFVDDLLAVYDSRADIDCVGGRILLFDQTDYPITIDERTSAVDYLPGRFVPPGALQGANFSFRRTALEAIGGIDTDFGAGTPFPCEDVDAVAAISWNGMTSTFDPRPTVFHHHGRKAADLPQLMASYDRGRGAYYAKYLMRPDSRAAYRDGWIRDRFAEIHFGGLMSLGRELRSAAKYALHRKRTGFLVLAAPVAAAYLAVYFARLVVRNLSKAVRR